MIWTKEQAKALTDRVLSFSKAEETFVVAQRQRARQPALRAQHRDDVGRLVGHTAWRSRRASASARAPSRPRSSTTRACSARCATPRRSRKALAGESRGDAGPRAADLRAGHARTSTMPRRRRPTGARRRSTTAIALSKKKDVVSAGFVETQAAMQAVASSKGLFAYDRFTAADYNLTARTPDGIGLGLGVEVVQRAAAARARRAGRRRRSTRRRWPKSPSAIEPGKYTVVLEPAAVADLLVVHAVRRPTRGRPTKGAASSRRRAAATASASRSSARRSASTRIRRIRSRRRIAFDNEGLPIAQQRLGREGRAEGPVLLALLGGEDGQEADRRARPT